MRSCRILRRAVGVASHLLHKRVDQRAIAAGRYGVEGAQESIAANLRLISIIGTEQVHSLPAKVVHLQDHLLRQFMLDTEAPHVGLRRLPIGIDDSIGVVAKRRRRAQLCRCAEQRQRIDSLVQFCRCELA